MQKTQGIPSVGFLYILWFGRFGSPEELLNTATVGYRLETKLTAPLVRTATYNPTQEGRVHVSSVKVSQLPRTACNNYPHIAMDRPALTYTIILSS